MSSRPVLKETTFARTKTFHWVRRRTKRKMRLRSDKFHQYETFKEIASASGERAKPMHMGVNGKKSLILSTILRCERYKKREKKISKEGLQDLYSTQNWNTFMKIQVLGWSCVGETLKQPIIATSKFGNGKHIPYLVNRHSYRGIKQPSKDICILSFRPTRIIDQSEGFPTVMTTYIIVSMIFKMEEVLTTL